MQESRLRGPIFGLKKTSFGSRARTSASYTHAHHKKKRSRARPQERHAHVRVTDVTRLAARTRAPSRPSSRRWRTSETEEGRKCAREQEGATRYAAASPPPSRLLLFLSRIHAIRGARTHTCRLRLYVRGLTPSRN